MAPNTRLNSTTRPEATQAGYNRLQRKEVYSSVACCPILRHVSDKSTTRKTSLCCFKRCFVVSIVNIATTHARTLISCTALAGGPNEPCCYWILNKSPR